MTCGFTTAGRL